jgi:VWFA-related protein
MRMAAHAKDLIDTLEGDDRMAVVTFTSHLQVRADFTDDREVLQRAVRATNLFADPGEVARSDDVSLLGAMDEEAARDAAWPETALAVLGEALGEIDGEKTIVVFGWGIGRFSRSGVQMRRDWGRARDAMESNRTSIFTIDVTQADDHSLAVGLKHVARQTGGMYQPTYHFPEAAVSRVSGALSGYYVLVFAKPTDSVGYHSVSVELRDRQGQALAKQFFVD